MTIISFEKYQGTGNDFIMIDNRGHHFPVEELSLISSLCHRKFGIGADGLILVQGHEIYDFEMIYYNPDGTQSLCGNGSRCAVMFSHALGIIQDKTTFLTIEGPLFAEIRDSRVHLKMPDVKGVFYHQEDLFLNTGSPHYVRFVPDADKVDVYHSGKEIRYSQKFHPAGTNVNFVQKTGKGSLYVRTYERGVENETLSCGTGVTASALALGLNENQDYVFIKTRGGDLEVSFKSDGFGIFTDIFLIGPAEKIFTGQIEIH
jgi:diaminopimelate epimerase